jgi:hypothetical protein
MFGASAALLVFGATAKRPVFGATAKQLTCEIRVNCIRRVLSGQDPRCRR